MRDSFLPFSPPSIGEAEVSEMVEALRSGWITTGPRVARFESEFAAAVGAESALAASSGTAALHLALLALGIRPGDVVLTTPMTFCSSVHVIEHTGARPVLVDVDRETLTIDPAQVAAAAVREPAARAILPVHLYGHPCDMDALVEVAANHGLALVEDAAHALPARYHGVAIGAAAGPVAGLVAFSFYATKNLTTAEGGMLTGPRALIEQARIWSLHGLSQNAYERYGPQGSWYYEVVLPGYKYNMTDLQAALGLVQLQRLPEMQSRRRQIAARYTAAFAGLEEVTPPPERPFVEHAWHIYALRLNLDRLRIDRREFIDQLRALNVGASVHFIPVHLHPYYRDRYGFAPGAFPVAESEYRRLVSLPLHPGLTDAEVDDVIDAVAVLTSRFRR